MNLALFQPERASRPESVEAQMLLAAAELYLGKIDGIFGPKALDALARWRDANIGKPVLSVVLDESLRGEYERLYGGLLVRKNWESEAATMIRRIGAARASYEKASTATGVPWWVVALLHAMEAGLDFKCHLHNGDSLSRRTVHVPAGRPVQGDPPFDWSFSAIDALKYDHFDLWHDWSLAGALYKMELYNGAGSRRHGVFTPYLWSGSQYYTEGRYVADSLWSPTAVSGEVGAAVLLKGLDAEGIVGFISK